MCVSAVSDTNRWKWEGTTSRLPWQHQGSRRKWIAKVRTNPDFAQILRFRDAAYSLIPHLLHSLSSHLPIRLLIVSYIYLPGFLVTFMSHFFKPVKTQLSAVKTAERAFAASNPQYIFGTFINQQSCHPPMQASNPTSESLPKPSQCHQQDGQAPKIPSHSPAQAYTRQNVKN